jgi:peptidoglycan/xylan/chitin deacetylase (PgdA/CDA1 family)
MFHRVALDVPHDPIGRGLTVAVETFEHDLDVLQRSGVHTYTAAEVARAYAEHRRVDGVVLTFDDGRADGYDVVFPLLRRHGMRATFYVNSGTIDGPFHMTWAELRAMRAAGMEIGCHGAHHLDLASLTSEEQRAEVDDCLEKVERHAGARPVTYAYASGRYDARALELLHERGIEAAVTEIPGVVRPGVDPLQWPRERVNRETSVASFAGFAQLAVTAPQTSRAQR